VVGRLVARKLGYRFLDTGLMYRAVTWAALQRRISMGNKKALTRLAQEAEISVKPGSQGEQVFIDGEDVTAELRVETVENAVSLVARVPGVREALVAQQQAQARGGGMVMVGRDIGTVVLPHAPLKVFLQASVAERARRRHLEFQASGHQVEYATVLQELQERDRLDTQRAHSPLRPARDAHVMDTGGLTVDQVVRRVLALVRE
jgi:cytidylate kinase